MKIAPTPMPGLLVIEPTVFADARGYFYESFNARQFAGLTGLEVQFVQDNQSCSARQVLRGLHYQIKQPQGKLVRVIQGEVFDVAVDLRRASPTFGQWHGLCLNDENKRSVWIPPGFAHGFFTLSATAVLIYKTTDYWAPEHERTLRWDDPDLAIHWPLESGTRPLLSDKDRHGALLREAETFD